LCFLFAPAAWSQAQFTTGAVQGDVLDEKGGTDGCFRRSQKSGHQLYPQRIHERRWTLSISKSAPGRYTLTITKAGFTTIVQENVNLTVGQVISIPVTVKVSAVAHRSSSPTSRSLKHQDRIFLHARRIRHRHHSGPRPQI